MAKQRKGAKKKRRSNSAYQHHNISGIGQHKRQGSKLIPPLAQLGDKMKPSSWADDHMPEMLWAVLLTGILDRRDYLNLFRRIAVLSREWFKREEPADGGRDDPGEDVGEDFRVIVDVTTLSEVTHERFKQFIAILLSHAQAISALLVGHNQEYIRSFFSHTNLKEQRRFKKAEAS